MNAGGGTTVARPSSLEHAGTIAAALLCGGCGWIHRRKEEVEVLDDAWIRRRLSVDFQVPVHVPPLGIATDGQPIHYVPLTLLRKAAPGFLNFDLIDETRRSLPLLTRAENAAISSAALEAAGLTALRRAPVAFALPEDVRKDIYRVALGDPADALGATEDLFDESRGDTAVRLVLTRDRDFIRLAQALAESSILMVPLIGGGGHRRIVKLSYDERITRFALYRAQTVFERLGWQGYETWIDTSFIGAANYHFEAEAPRGLAIVEAGLALDETGRGALGDPKDLVPGDDSRVHLYVPNATMEWGAFGWIVFSVRGGGWVAGAALTSAGVFWIMIGGLLAAPLLSKSPASAPALLLLFPGVIASYLVRPAHGLTSRLLNLARRTLMVSGAVAYLAAARVAVSGSTAPASPAALRWWFGGSAAIALICALVLYLTRRLPKPEHANDLLQRMVWRADYFLGRHGIAMRDVEMSDDDRRIARICGWSLVVVTPTLLATVAFLVWVALGDG